VSFHHKNQTYIREAARRGGGDPSLVQQAPEKDVVKLAPSGNERKRKQREFFMIKDFE